MLGFYEFVDDCRESGVSEEEAFDRYCRVLEDARRSREDSYYSNPYYWEERRVAELLERV